MFSTVFYVQVKLLNFTNRIELFKKEELCKLIELCKKVDFSYLSDAFEVIDLGTHFIVADHQISPIGTSAKQNSC